MSSQTPGPSIPCSIVGETARNQARNALIRWRSSLPCEFRSGADSSIAVRLESLLAEAPFSAVRVLGAFWPVRGEPDLLAFLRRWHARARAVALPRVVVGGGLEFGRWSPEGAMRPERFGIPVPQPFERLEPELLIVPCVGFDTRGYRLGYGGGHYDRTLASRTAPAIGVAYDACELRGFAEGAHDRPLARIVTETRSIRPR